MNWFFEKINITDKPLARLTKIKGEGMKLPISKVKETLYTCNKGTDDNDEEGNTMNNSPHISLICVESYPK